MNRALNRFAALTTGCTFLLLIAGALVTGNDAADSVPDWPLAYHRLIPPLVGGIRFEFTHRVVAGLVAILTLILAVWIARREPRRWVRNVGWIALALVVAQALLGALRVLKGDPAVTATLHPTLAQLFFVSLICLTVFTGQWWQSNQPTLHDAGSPSLRALALATSLIIVIQTILGAGYRHGAFGIWPHLVGAGAVTAAVIVVGRTVRIRFGEIKSLHQAIIFLHSFFGLQILLGGAAWWAVQAQQRAPQPMPLLVGITVAHVLGASLLLSASVVLTSRCYRLIPVDGAITEPSRPSKHWPEPLSDPMATPQISTAHSMFASARIRPRAYLSLIKPDVTFLVVLTTFAGFYMASTGPLDGMKLLQTLIGTTLVAAGTASLNHYIERREDAVMRRTARRPLPLGLLPPSEALILGVAMALLGLFLLAWKVNGLSTIIALATCASYLGVYTPLKKHTPWATAIGAFPGALPPLIGWAAARGGLGPGAWVLFGILFFWQFPHFLAIAWIYREDYARAGIRMLPVVDRAGGSTYAQIVVMSAILVPVSLLPTLLGMAGTLYFFSALLVGMALMGACLWAARQKTNVRAKWLMHATVIHIPVLLGLLMLDKLPR